jgi:hypothetical protein
MKLLLLLSAVASVFTATLGFGLTESGNSYIVDTSGGLIFTGRLQSLQL